MALGCATHTYLITDRDGRTVADVGDLVDIEYNRLLNETSTATVTIGVDTDGCCAQLSRIRSWNNKLNIYRDGTFMWSGFIVSIEWTREDVKVIAVDLIGLLDRRVPHQDFNFTDTDLTVIAADLIRDGFAPDDPGHTITTVGLADVTGGRSYEQNIGQTADHLRDLADTGIDFTAVGNNIIILPDGFDDVVGRLSDDDLPQGLSVAEDGSRLVTRQIVAGGTDLDIIGTAGGSNSYYGLLEQYEEQNTITTQNAADLAARARLASSAVVPVFIDTQSVTLSPSAQVSINDLVPGWCVDVTSQGTCRDISQRLKITGLNVKESGGTDGNPGQEQIILQVAATGGQIEVS